MRPQHALISSHKLPIGRFLGADFGRRLLALRQVHSRPAGRLTCRVRVRHDDVRRSETLSLYNILRIGCRCKKAAPPNPNPGTPISRDSTASAQMEACSGHSLWRN